MTQAPTTVWNEVRFTSDGISISLFSESKEGGAILEDEMWFTYDELQEMAPSGPKNLGLSRESSDALAKQRGRAAMAEVLSSSDDDTVARSQTEPSQESADSQESGEVENLPPVGNLDSQESGDGQQSVDSQEYTYSQESGEVEHLPEVGQLVIDTNPPSWSQDNRLEVVNVSDKQASEYVIQEYINTLSNKTVFDANPSCDSDETVVEARYLSGNDKTYAFPLSRLDW